MNGCVCVHGQDVLNINLFYPMAKKLDDTSSIPNGGEPSPIRDEMFSVRSKILKTPRGKGKNSNTSFCNGDIDNYIGEESSGVYFARKLDEEEQRISKLCFAVQLLMWENSPPEEVKGKIRAATGKARLLMSSKFKQFKDLCDLNAGIITTEDGKIPTKSDLEGFWDLVMLQVVDVDSHFTKIEKLRKNGWIDEEPEVDHSQTPKSPVPKDGKTSPKKKTSLTKASSSSNSKKSSKEVEAKKRQEARKRLAEAKKAARKRQVQSPPNDDADVIICATPPRKPES